MRQLTSPSNTLFSNTVSRPDVIIQSASGENIAGSRSGGDAAREDGVRHDGAFEGDIDVSADIAADQAAAVPRSFADAGAIRVSGK